MGYSTEFFGEIKVEPPLNEAEMDYLRRFSGSRRMHRKSGPYYADPGDDFGQEHTDDVVDYNRPHPTQPELWCQWVPSADGSAIEWDGGEKFYSADQWMKYVIDHFLRPGAIVSTLSDIVEDSYDPAFADFTFDHVCNGEIDAEGEESHDRWKLIVQDNAVKVQRVESLNYGPITDV